MQNCMHETFREIHTQPAITTVQGVQYGKAQFQSAAMTCQKHIYIVKLPEWNESNEYDAGVNKVTLTACQLN